MSMLDWKMDGMVEWSRELK